MKNPKQNCKVTGKERLYKYNHIFFLFKWRLQLSHNIVEKKNESILLILLVMFLYMHIWFMCHTPTDMMFPSPSTLGDTVAEAFTNAFVQVKVVEIRSQMEECMNCTCTLSGTLVCVSLPRANFSECISTGEWFTTTSVCVHDCQIHTYIHACMHTYIHTYIHTYMYTYIHACMHTYIHTCMGSPRRSWWGLVLA